MPRLLKVCLNGGRRRDEHPSVPITPAELAADAVRSHAAGATAVHLHPRDEEGAESLDGEDVAAAVAAVRRACPELPVGVTTGAWILPDPAARVAAIRQWPASPDFASVNVHEDGAADVAAALDARGIGVEAGVWTVDAAARLASWTTPVERILVECMQQDPEAALRNALAVLAVLPEAGPPVLLHAEGAAVWPVLREAVRLGLDTRIGLEDTLVLPDGTLAPGNDALVTAAISLGA